MELTDRQGKVADIVGERPRVPARKVLTVSLMDPSGSRKIGRLHAALALKALTARANMLFLGQIGGVLLLLVLIAAVVRATFRRLVATPLARIGTYMQRPDLLTTAPHLRLTGVNAGSNDELGELESAINTMVENRRQDLQELESYRQHLEELVEQRTQQLKSTQEELVRAENLAALGSMVGGVAHELNTPIGNGMIAATTIREHTEEVREKLEAGTLRKADLEQPDY